MVDITVLNVIIQSGAFALVAWIVLRFMNRVEQHMEKQILVTAELVMQLSGKTLWDQSTIHSEAFLREKGMIK